MSYQSGAQHPVGEWTPSNNPYGPPAAGFSVSNNPTAVQPSGRQGFNMTHPPASAGTRILTVVAVALSSLAALFVSGHHYATASRAAVTAEQSSPTTIATQLALLLAFALLIGVAIGTARWSTAGLITIGSLSIATGLIGSLAPRTGFDLAWSLATVFGSPSPPPIAHTLIEGIVMGGFIKYGSVLIAVAMTVRALRRLWQRGASPSGAPGDASTHRSLA